MSVTFIDIPGPLPNSTEPIDFTTDRAVGSISIEYNPTLGNGLRETVWDGVADDGSGGDFSFLYRASSHSGDRRTWHIVRATPWPAQLRIRVQELKADPIPSSSSWTLLYGVDLRTLATQSISGPTENNVYQNFTLDGQPWYYHTSSGKVNLVNGQGLVGTASSYGNPGLPYGGIHFGLKVYQMPGYNPAKETICQVMFGGGNYDSTTLPPTGHVGADIWSGGEAWGYGPGNNTQQVRLNIGSVGFTDGQTKTVFSKSGGGPEQFSNFCLATRAQPFLEGVTNSGKVNYRSGYFLRDVGGVLPDPEAMLGLGCDNGLGTAQQSSYKMGFYAGNTIGGFINFTAIKIRLMQRTVP